MLYRTILVFFLFPFVLIYPACSVQSEGSRDEAPCKVSFSNLDGLPDMVLISTDIVSTSSFAISSRPLQSKYSAEMGGSTLLLHVSEISNSKMITRTFSEPGAKQHIKKYSQLCIKDNIFSTTGLKGKLVEGGLILLEENSGVEGIPSDLWVFYKDS